MFRKIYTEYKIKNKKSCFRIYYETNDCICYYNVSFLTDFCDEKILKELKIINDSSNFKRWLSPSEVERNNLKI